jgi:hypothetical protein
MSVTSAPAAALSTRLSGATRNRMLVALAIAAVLVLVGLQIWAAANFYALRVIGDTPSFLALIRDLALHPLRPTSTFFGTSDTRSIHASPYLQALALIWRAVAPAGRLTDPMALGRFVAVCSVPVGLFVLSMVWLYAKEVGGRTAGYVAIPALLTVFGPVHIAFPSDLSLNGFMYAGYYPTTLATGLTIASLIMLRRTSPRWSIATVPVVALTLTTDPLNGAMLAGLAIVYACRVVRTAPGERLRIPLILTWAFLASSAWPAFDVFSAFSASGLPVPLIITSALVIPQLWLSLGSRLVTNAGRFTKKLTAPVTAQTELRVAVVSAYCTALLAIWGIYTMTHWPADHSVLTANRLGFYWNDQRERWLLLFAAGACGLIGLHRLARRGQGELLMWFLGFYAVGIIGAIAALVGVQVPLYYRFILLCQVPIAIGLACFITHHESRLAATIVAALLGCILVFKLATLMTVSDRLTYFGARLPSVWNMGQVIPPESGVVASDPGTSYYVPASTQNRVLTVGLGHADSGAESARAESGYDLIRQVYVGSPASATSSIRLLWKKGVRWVVVEKFTSFQPVDLKHFYAAPYSALVSAADVDLAARYNSRLSAAANVVADDGEFTIYRLDPARLATATAPTRPFAPSIRRRISTTLQDLEWAGPSAIHADAARLRSLGVRMVTMNVGWMGSTPEITAYRSSIASDDGVAITIPRRGAQTCERTCARARTSVRTLGATQLADTRFVIERL